MVFALAQNTGWTEEHILWEVPLSRALQYWHAWLYASGIWTVPKSAPLEQTVEKLTAFAAGLDEGEVDDGEGFSNQ
jgi:hypothetical protein